MKEVWDLYDSKRNKTGCTVERGKTIPEGFYHLVVSVWIINNRGEYLLSQRHPDKSYPLRWECTGGAVLSGEDSFDGALREVNEELGIILNPKDGRRISRICREQTQDLYDVWVFYIDADISDITLQETEVVDVKWVTCEELINMERKGELHPLLDVSSVTKNIILWRNSMRTSICGIDCMKCELKETCFGCAVTDGHPFHGGCVLAACCLSNGYDHCGKCHNEKCRLKEQVIAEFCKLGIEDMEEITGLNACKGSYINLTYTFSSGQAVKLLDDDKIYLGNQLSKKDSSRYYGIAADERTLIVSEYDADGSNAEIIVYKKRNV